MKQSWNSVTFEGKDYKLREVEVEGNVELVGNHTLHDAIIGEDGLPINKAAEAIDNEIIFYVPDYMFEYGDAQLRTVIYEELEIDEEEE